MATSPLTHNVTIGSGDLSVTISPVGTELKSLRYKGKEWLWQGDAASWPRQAPVLFPHCGRTARRTIRVVGWTNEENGGRGGQAELLSCLGDQ